jgi:ribosomal protein S6
VELERNFKISEDLLRYLTLRIDEPERQAVEEETPEPAPAAVEEE